MNTSNLIRDMSKIHFLVLGQCPSLYSHKELAEVAASLTPPAQLNTSSSDSSILLIKRSAHDGSVHDAQETAQEKLDRTLELYFGRVLSNLHVVVMAHVPVLEGNFLIDLATNFCCYF